jgi:hypothetical protein
MQWILANQGAKTQILDDQKVSRNRPDFLERSKRRSSFSFVFRIFSKGVADK